MGSLSFLPAGVPKTLAQLFGQHPNIRLVEYFIMNSGDFVDFRRAIEKFAPAEVGIAGGQYWPVRASENSGRAA